MTRSAKEVVELYYLAVWNKRDFALAEELMGESVIRHDVGEVTTLTHDQGVQRRTASTAESSKSGTVAASKGFGGD